MASISCIICAYNEAERIGRVLSALKGHPLIGEVIVVDDYSSDATQEEVAKFPNTILIPHDRNMGKSCSVATGIGSAKHDLVMLLDADLCNLTLEDISALAAPVVSGEVDATISLRRNSLWIHKLLGLDFTSGERVFPRRLVIEHMKTLTLLPGFGLEVFLNDLLIGAGCRITIVKWTRVSHARKTDKVGIFRGVAAEIKMIFQILRVRSVKQIVMQNLALLGATKASRDLHQQDC